MRTCNFLLFHLLVSIVLFYFSGPSLSLCMIIEVFMKLNFLGLRWSQGGKFVVGVRHHQLFLEFCWIIFQLHWSYKQLVIFSQAQFIVQYSCFANQVLYLRIVQVFMLCKPGSLSKLMEDVAKSFSALAKLHQVAMGSIFHFL